MLLTKSTILLGSDSGRHTELIRPPAVLFIGDNAFDLAESFGEKVWYHSNLIYAVSEMTDTLFAAFIETIQQDIVYNNSVAYFLDGIDEASALNQSRLADLLESKPGETWPLSPLRQLEEFLQCPADPKVFLN